MKSGRVGELGLGFLILIHGSGGYPTKKRVIYYPPETRKNRKNKSVSNRIGVCRRVIGLGGFGGHVG
jgi:hypothetical protein